MAIDLPPNQAVRIEAEAKKAAQIRLQQEKLRAAERERQLAAESRRKASESSKNK